MAVKVFTQPEQNALRYEDDESLSPDAPGAMFTDDGFGEDHLMDMFLGDTIIFGGIEFSSEASFE